MGRKLPFFPVYHHRGKLSISNFAEVQKTPLRRQKQRGQGKVDYWFFTESWGANKDLGEAPKSCTRKEHESATNPIAKRGQGGDFVPFRLPLAGSRDSVPCGFWGNAPTVPRATSMPNALNKGAGSEASLPVTLRSRRSAPKLLFPQDSVKNQKVKQAKCAGRGKNRVPAHFLCTKKEKPLMQLPLMLLTSAWILPRNRTA